MTEVNKSNGSCFLSISVFFWSVRSQWGGLKTWSRRNGEEERLEERKSGRKRVIIEQSWSAAAWESKTGPRSHQKCNGSKGKNMIFNQHQMGGSGNKWEEESTAKWEIVIVKDYRGIEMKRETDISDLEFMWNVRKEASEAKTVNVILNQTSSG